MWHPLLGLLGRQPGMPVGEEEEWAKAHAAVKLTRLLAQRMDRANGIASIQ